MMKGCISGPGVKELEYKGGEAMTKEDADALRIISVQIGNVKYAMERKMPLDYPMFAAFFKQVQESIADIVRRNGEG